MSDYQLTDTDIVVRTLDGARIPSDPKNTDRAAYEAWLGSGNTPDPYVAPVPPAVSVTPRQARLALNAAGLLPQVEAAVAAADKATQITWEFASTISRDDPLINTLASALGLSTAQIDALFAMAATL